jgi:hypothetical protein
MPRIVLVYILLIYKSLCTNSRKVKDSKQRHYGSHRQIILFYCARVAANRSTFYSTGKAASNLSMEASEEDSGGA